MATPIGKPKGRLRRNTDPREFSKGSTSLIQVCCLAINTDSASFITLKKAPTMPTAPSHATLKAKRIEAEQRAQELRDAEINAAFEENPISDPDYHFKCRVISKQRLATQKIRQHVGRKRFSIEVQRKKLDRLLEEQEVLTSQLNKKEQYLAQLQEEVRERREVVYRSLEECQQA